MKLKALIKNKAKENNISAQLVLQNYMLERLLERVSVTKYKKNFIFKGGFLIGSIVGIEARTTMDLDTTIKGFDLTKEQIVKIFSEVCEVDLHDNVSFEIISIKNIRDKDEYPGFCINLQAHYLPIKVHLSVDITTGDVITPREVEYEYKLMFEEKTINIMAYNLETILAEKIETILSRAEVNTRPRDYYDIFILWKLHKDRVNLQNLKKALENTSRKRKSIVIFENYNTILNNISSSKQIEFFWNKYKEENDYAKNIDLINVINILKKILSTLF